MEIKSINHPNPFIEVKPYLWEAILLYTCPIIIPTNYSILETITLLGYSKLPTCLIKSITCHISWEHLRTNTPKRCPFHYRGLECKSRKSRNTWSNREIWPWSTGWSRAKTNRVLPRERTGHSKHHLPTTQEKTLHMDITRWPTPKSDWLYSLQLERLYTVSKNKTGSWVWLRSGTPYCQFRLKLKKVGKTTRPFRYDLNQILYDYTAEVRNRFKGPDLTDKSAWWTMDGGSWHCTGDRDQDHPHGKERQKSKMAVWGGLTNSCEKKRGEKQRRKGKI